jgi:hypothetical protein
MIDLHLSFWAIAPNNRLPVTIDHARGALADSRLASVNRRSSHAW